MIVKNNYNIKKRKYEESDNEDDNPHNKKKFITKNKKYKYKKQRKGYQLLNKSNIQKTNPQKYFLTKSLGQYGGKEPKVKDKKNKILKEKSTHRKIKKKATLKTTRKKISSSFSRKGKQFRTYTTFSAKKRNQLRGEREAKRFGIQRKQKEANEIKAKMMMYPKKSKKYEKLKQEYLKVTTSLNLKKDKKRKKESTSGFGKRSANKTEKKLMNNIKSLNSLEKHSFENKKKLKVQKTGVLLQKQSRYLKESTKNGNVFVDKNGKIISTEEMIADENYKYELSKYISKYPEAKPYEIKNELLRISKQNMGNKNYKSEQQKYDLKKASEILTEAHERKGRQKLTQIELESKDKINKNQKDIDELVDNYKTKYEINLEPKDREMYKQNPEEFLKILQENPTVSYEEKEKLEENIRKIKKHKGIVESSQKKQKFLDNKISKKMSNRVEQKTNDIEAKEISLKEIEEELKETKLNKDENKKWYELRNKSISIERFKMSNNDKQRFVKLTEKRKLAEKLNKEKKSLEADIKNKKDDLSQEKTELIKANQIRVSQLEQKKRTGDNNAKIQSHINSLENNCDKAEFEEMKRKYDALGDNDANKTKKQKILDEFNKGNTDKTKDITEKKMDAEKEADKNIKEIENKNKEISESEKELKELELAEKKLKEKSDEEKQLMEILETKKNELKGLPVDDENEKQSKISDIEEKQKVLALSQKDTQDKMEKLNSKKKEKRKYKIKLKRNIRIKKRNLKTLKENLPEYTKNKISKIESDDEKKKKSERVDKTLRFEVKEELKDKIEKEIKNNEDFQLDKGKLMTDKEILDKLNTDPEYKNNPNMDDLKKHYQKKINLQSNPDLQKKVALEVFDNREVTKAEIDKINELFGTKLDTDKIELEKIKQLSDDEKKNKFIGNNAGLENYLKNIKLNKGTKEYYDEKEKITTLNDKEKTEKKKLDNEYVNKKIRHIEKEQDNKTSESIRALYGNNQNRTKSTIKIQSAFRRYKVRQKIKKKKQIDNKIKAIKELKDELKEGKVDKKELNKRLEEISQDDDINNSNNNNLINKNIEYREKMKNLLKKKDKRKYKKKMLNAEIKKEVEKILKNKNLKINNKNKEILLKNFNNIKELNDSIKKNPNKNEIINKYTKLKEKIKKDNPYIKDNKLDEIFKDYDNQKNQIENNILETKLKVIKDKKITEKKAKNEEIFQSKIDKRAQKYKDSWGKTKAFKKSISTLGHRTDYKLGRIKSKLDNYSNLNKINEKKLQKLQELEDEIKIESNRLKTMKNPLTRKSVKVRTYQYNDKMKRRYKNNKGKFYGRRNMRRLKFLEEQQEKIKEIKEKLEQKEKLNNLKSITLNTNQNTNLNGKSYVGGHISKNKINFINKLHSKDEKNKKEKNKKNKKNIKPYKNIRKSLKKKINVNKKSNKVYQYINKNKKSKKQLLRNKYKKLSKKIYL